MKEVYSRLFVSSQESYEYHRDRYYLEDDEFSFVFAAKEPWHRQAVGYTGRACDKSHPEYLMARRENRLILNLVDAPKPEFFDKRIIDAALDFIYEQALAGKKVLIACNEGKSRSASIALLYLVKHGIIKGKTLEDCEAEFMKVYPEYNPGSGIRGFVKEHWINYKQN